MAAPSPGPPPARSSAVPASPASGPLYTVDPFEQEGLARMFSTHPPLARRVELLRRLDPDARSGLDPDHEKGPLSRPSF